MGTITHAKVSALADDPVAAAAGAVVPSDWNAPHSISLSSSDVGLGNVTNDAQTKSAIVPNTAPSAGQIPVGNAGGTAYAPVSISGDLSLTSAGVAAAVFTTGTWTPVDSSGAGLTLTSVSGTYATIGKMVFITAEFVYPTTADTSTAVIGGLPFTSVGNKFSLTANLPSGGGAAGNNGSGSPYVVASGTTIRFSLAGSKDSDLTNTSESNRSYRISGFYLKT